MRTIFTGLSTCMLLTIAASSVGGPLQLPQQSGAELGNLIAPHVSPGQEIDHEIAGLASGSQAELLTWDRIYALALVRARTRREAVSPTLDPAALTEEMTRAGVADFARFRTDFLGPGPFRDPGPAVLELEARLLAIDNARHAVAVLESLRTLFVERSQGASSGLGRIDIDMVFAASVRARQALADAIRQFRDGLDALKVMLGLSPRAPVILDRQSLEAFPAVFDSVENWARYSTRSIQELYRRIDELPAAGEVLLNGEPILAKLTGQWEEVLAAATQRALENRSKRDKSGALASSGLELELRVRRRIRSLYDQRQEYDGERKCYELAIRLRDQAFERLVAPPSAVVTSRSSLVATLLEQLTQVRETENRLIRLWTSFRAERLELYHDMGVLPYTDWKTFYADLFAGPGAAAEGPAVRPKPSSGRSTPG